MITTQSVRGPITDKNNHSVVAFTPSDWVDEVISIPHPESGHMGQSMAIVTTAEPTQRTKRYDINETEEEYTVDGAILTAENPLTQTTYKVDTTDPIESPALLKDGATYSVYGIQQQVTESEWETIIAPTMSGKWVHNPFYLTSLHINPTTADDKRMIERSVTYNRDPSADPTDPKGYTLSKNTTPITVTNDEITPL